MVDRAGVGAYLWGGGGSYTGSLSGGGGGEWARLCEGCACVPLLPETIISRAPLRPIYKSYHRKKKASFMAHGTLPV